MTLPAIALESIRRNTKLACTAGSQSVLAHPRTSAASQLATCEKAKTLFELLGVVAVNVGADRRAQEALGASAPRADAPRLRMLALHQEMFSDATAFRALRPEQTQVLLALRMVTNTQIAAIRSHAKKVREQLGAAADLNADFKHFAS